MDYRPAEFVRFIDDAERLDDLLDEAKSDTWTKGREHAVLVLQRPGFMRVAMVRGGLDGILLDRGADGTVTLDVGGTAWQVSKLAWHVHPYATGPSDHDRRVLDVLGQASSMLYEIGGPDGGTRFPQMSERRP